MAIFQSYVPPEMQGRVFTLLISTVSMMAPLGLAVAGPLADGLGLRSVFVTAGIGCVVMGLVWICMPTILNLEDQVNQQVGEAAGGRTGS